MTGRFLELQQTTCVAEQHLAIIGQRDTPRCPPEQGPFGLELKPLDLLAHRRLRQVEPLRGAVETAACVPGMSGVLGVEVENVAATVPGTQTRGRRREIDLCRDHELQRAVAPLKLPNRRVRTRTHGGVGGAASQEAPLSRFAAAVQNSGFDHVGKWSYQSVVTTGNLRSLGEALFSVMFSSRMANA
jgi:hypothetical protein